MGYRKYTDDFKEQVVREYLEGKSQSQIIVEYNINKTQLHRWKKKWREYGSFPDERGKAKIGRPRKIKREDMTDNEYIEYLEMQLEIKKYVAFHVKRERK